MSFAATPQQEGVIKYERYPAKTGVSPAANLRQAFTDSPLLSLAADEAVVMVDAPVSLIPQEEYDAASAETLYRSVLTMTEGQVVVSSAVPELNVVATFAIPRDLKVVVSDHYRRYAFIPVMQPVWTYLYRRNFTGDRRKLFAYFHDRKVDVVAFRQNRFHFCNAFDAVHSADAVYYLLGVWRQLGLDARTDQLHIVGGVPYAAELDRAIAPYISHIHKINPQAGTDPTDKPMQTVMPFDVQALYATLR